MHNSCFLSQKAQSLLSFLTESAPSRKTDSRAAEFILNF